jgi:hypothetical protein
MDEIDDLLTPAPVPPKPPAQRAELWRQTAVVQRRRRWLRSARWAGLLTAFYAAGAASVWWWQRPTPVPVVRRAPEPPGQPSPAPPKSAPAEPEADPYRNDPPQVIERWAALAEGRRRVTLYRRAGDLYYEVYGDHAAAIRCYRQALDSGTEADLAVQADRDNWLLMSIKAARLKERSDARN